MELHSGFILEAHFTPSDLVLQLQQCSEEEGHTPGNLDSLSLQCSEEENHTPGSLDSSSLSINTQCYPSVDFSTSNL